jgi:L-alanine-DL-glutamate epimerase-like enolase superfamily enzyme
LTIETVKTLSLRYDYPDERGHWCAEGHIGSRLTSLVFVTLDNGLTGVGSAYSHPQLVQTIVEDHLAPFLVGEDPRDIDALWNRMYSLTRWYGRKGAAVSALGAVDIALWDIKGKLLGEPLYRLLGGTAGDVEAYASGLLWQDDLSLLEEEALRHLEDGFRLMKMRLGRDHDYDQRAVDRLCNVLRGRSRVAVDGTHRYSLAEAEEFAKFLAERDVAWFEEPFPPEDVEAYAALRGRSDVPLAAGENEFGVQGFAELLRMGAIDIAQPDASRTGGISECVRIGGLADAHGVAVVTHTWSDAVALIANAHVVRALSNGVAVEVDRTGCPLIDGLLADGLPLEDGVIRLSEKPGLGIELDPEALAQLQVPETDCTRAGNYADLVFGGGRYVPVPTHARSWR